MYYLGEKLFKKIISKIVWYFCPFNSKNLGAIAYRLFFPNALGDSTMKQTQYISIVSIMGSHKGLPYKLITLLCNKLLFLILI